MKISPRLQDLLKSEAQFWPDEVPGEIRALLAVARDHDRLLTYCVGMIGGSGMVKRDIWEEFPVLANSLKLRNRLAKVSAK